jgi:hypothetical protein
MGQFVLRDHDHRPSREWYAPSKRLILLVLDIDYLSPDNRGVGNMRILVGTVAISDFGSG